MAKRINIPNVTGNIVITVRTSASVSTPTTYSIANNLSHCSTSNTSSSVNQGVSYSAIITPNSGYELLNVAITMGGTNVTGSVYTYQNGNAVINIPNVTGNVVITVQATAITVEPTTYTITSILPNCTSSNTANGVNKNASYSTLISPNDGYKIDSITVTMNNTDITSSVVTDE